MTVAIKAKDPNGIPKDRPMMSFRPSPSFFCSAPSVGVGVVEDVEVIKVVVGSGGSEEFGLFVIELRVDADVLRVVGGGVLALVLVLVLVLVRVVLVDVELECCATTNHTLERIKTNKSRICIMVVGLCIFYDSSRARYRLGC